MSSGIQALLKTEKEAAEIVNEARKYRTTRLKSARADAQGEIDQYKKQKDAELEAFEKEHEGVNDKVNKDADAQVDAELKNIKAKYAEKKSSVVKLLVDATISAKPELHVNASS
jgi:V-type H+-transporting ATPase subunit G